MALSLSHKIISKCFLVMQILFHSLTYLNCCCIPPNMHFQSKILSSFEFDFKPKSFKIFRWKWKDLFNIISGPIFARKFDDFTLVLRKRLRSLLVKMVHWVLKLGGKAASNLKCI